MRNKYQTSYYQCSCGKYIDPRSRVCPEDGEDDKEHKVQKRTLEIEDNWTGQKRMGQVVKWGRSGDLWLIVQVNSSSLSLVSLSDCNVGGGPSVDWPWDPNERIHKIEVVANSVREYITKCLRNVFPGLDLGRPW